MPQQLLPETAADGSDHDTPDDEPLRPAGVLSCQSSWLRVRPWVQPFVPLSKSSNTTRTKLPTENEYGSVVAVEGRPGREGGQAVRAGEEAREEDPAMVESTIRPTPMGVVEVPVDARVGGEQLEAVALERDPIGVHPDQ